MGSRDLATTASNFSRSLFRWVAAAILPVRAAVRPGVVPAREETEGRGRGGDMVDVNNIQG